MRASSVAHRVGNGICGAFPFWVSYLNPAPVSWIQKSYFYFTADLYTLWNMSGFNPGFGRQESAASHSPSHRAVIGPLVSGLHRRLGWNECWNWTALTVADSGASIHWPDRTESRAMFSSSCLALCGFKRKFRIWDASLLFIQGT